VSLRPCSACSERPVGQKLSSCYWSWNRADRSRVAYLQRLCITCFCMRVLPMIGLEYGAEIMCPLCHSPSGDDMDPVYCKVYVPGQVEQALELPTCPKCAVALRSQAIEGATQLDDRNTGFGGQAPEQSAQDTWSSLGLPGRA